MELSISDEKTKQLLTEVIIEMAKSKREVLYEVILDALEEVGLANAIAEGRSNNYVAEAEVLAVLKTDVK